ncbi:Uma2 family endonuclease [Scytonema hofmannii FACHB-248]|uniref:Uma2 family endonuclease n=1 Tax=Scytonema hofmannii FACHB-248 TaxID=1842502 RepID=A0ABR8GJ43_9CYAN|nr:MULTISPECIES: Uma2 family endonuclease [Nostocales]MBD2603190.1 Uma2 family endonuclease [Scytonema hofmannii FACHB-248]
MNALTVNLKPIFELTDEQFFQLCQVNENLRFERTATGELIIMSPTGGETSNRNAGLTAQIWIWNEQNKLGKVFDSSGGFKLPNGADRSPDASWVKLERWNALTQKQQTRFLPLCPDFVVELLSPSDSLRDTQEKMREYRDNGARLGWLINRKSRQVEIYRIGQEVEVLESPVSLSGEDILPGFVLNLEAIW